jgi:hypothetical protein
MNDFKNWYRRMPKPHHYEYMLKHSLSFRIIMISIFVLGFVLGYLTKMGLSS